ncbi:MAG: hypothetical protein IT472_08135 [Thermomonas sp.]|uniref:hypothetical protein n=1 Tax=Thermomonas sp. TaxID=1971895 RepID=UPI0026218CAE|nr:hypothetical protein [Thermomonas sp.]MCC7097132.1 hypothetical protein [Thermomonas sp.]
MPRRASSIAIVRLALMAVLMLGIFLPPAFAAVCDIEDVQVALDQSTGAAAAAAADPTDASQGNSVCCANPACGGCCLHAAVPDANAVVVAARAVPGLAVAALVSAVRTSGYPVDIRPPIAN